MAGLLGGCQTIEMVAPSEALPQAGAAPALAAATPLDTDPAARSRPRVFLMRGLAQTVSEGVDHLSAKLVRQGYRASVHAYGEWPAIAAQIIEDRRASGGASRAVIVGHSLGANSVVALVNTLAARGVEVDLAVTFDPTVDLTVQGGARQFLNFYQSDNGWGRAVGVGAGARGVENIDLKTMEHLTHFTIDRDARVHERVLTAIRQIPARAAPVPAVARARDGRPS
ncbi:hypothetical protein [Phreatobacter sp.]|uniref:hypothetical protein n=1 Tax=Phreatobacter sp. TaxID=1966341 RepID=UPI0022BE58F7|nr:hypothetical protein [Phreatobacter sp.]MCZ8315345.1 hypothetical protein [Phreatobacter sp.]